LSYENNKILEYLKYFYDGFSIIFLFQKRESKSTASCHTKAVKPYQIYLYT